MSIFRIVVAGQAAMFERKFDPDPVAGDVFQMASGDWFQVKNVLHDPVGPGNPEMLIQAQSVRSYPWTDASRSR